MEMNQRHCRFFSIQSQWPWYLWIVQLSSCQWNKKTTRFFGKNEFLFDQKHSENKQIFAETKVFRLGMYQKVSHFVRLLFLKSHLFFSTACLKLPLSQTFTKDFSNVCIVYMQWTFPKKIANEIYVLLTLPSKCSVFTVFKSQYDLTFHFWWIVYFAFNDFEKKQLFHFIIMLFTFSTLSFVYAALFWCYYSSQSSFWSTNNRQIGYIQLNKVLLLSILIEQYF